MIDGTAYMIRTLKFDENIALMPLIPYDFNELPQFIPDKRLLRYFYSDYRFSTTPIDWYLAYLHILLSLRFIWYKPYSNFYFLFNSVDEWCSSLDTYTFSRKFLEYLLEDLVNEEQTEGALLVIKKLHEMETEEERFEL